MRKQQAPQSPARPNLECQVRRRVLKHERFGKRISNLLVLGMDLSGNGSIVAAPSPPPVLQIDKYAHSIHYMDCSVSGTSCSTTASGIKQMTANLTTRRPVLGSNRVGSGWSDYHYFNRIQLVHPGKEITCPNGHVTGEFIAVGFAKGRFVNGTYNNEIIVEKYYRDPILGVVCEDESTELFPNDPSALLFELHWNANVDDIPTWLGGAWEIKVWLGYWKDLATVPTSWSLAPSPEYGQEIVARYGDKHNVIAPLNFGHKANIRGVAFSGGPWHSAYMPPAFNERSNSRTDAPFSVTDLYLDDRTSISSCVPVNNLCE